MSHKIVTSRQNDGMYQNRDTLPDLASRLGWLPCGECGTKGKRLSVTLPGYPDCPSCNGIGFLPSPVVPEAMAEALCWQRSEEPDIDWLVLRHSYMLDARAAWEAQARVILEGEK